MDDELMGEVAPVVGAAEVGADAASGAEERWDDWVEAQEAQLAAEGTAPEGQYREPEYGAEEWDGPGDPLQGWVPALQQLEALGITPEQFAARLEEVQYGGGQSGWEQPGWGQTPALQFSDWLAGQEIDAEECTRAELLSLQSTWRHEQTLAHYQQQAEAAQLQAFQSQWHADLQQVATQYPEFGNPVLRDALINTYEGRFGVQPDPYQLAVLAGELREAIHAHTSAQVARYAQQKQWDASVPVVAGGSAPAPVGAVDFHHLNPTQQQEFLESHFAAVSRSG